MEEIVNRVQKSGIITLDLTSFLPKEEVVEIDLKDNLWNELVLREKDFRSFIKEHNWSSYEHKVVAVFCSADAIIPTWAYMLVASALAEYTPFVYFGDTTQAQKGFIEDRINALHIDDYADARIVIKGCAEIPDPEALFLKLTARLRPVVKVLMYGEPCSTVPVYKKPRKA